MAPRPQEMGMEDVPPQYKPTSKFKRFPKDRDWAWSMDAFLKHKREADGAEGLWRIHDKLYDLSSMSHPGGDFWIKTTKGTDITELFETHHLTELPKQMMEKYYVREATLERNYPYTFHEDGFYKSVRRRALETIKTIPGGIKPAFKMYFLQDALSTGIFTFLFLAAYFQSYIFAIISGFFMGLNTMLTHNFFHQKDNWRMYVFDLSLFSSQEWRITHAISHHMTPNTVWDIELTLPEPIVNFLPMPDQKKQYWWSIFSQWYFWMFTWTAAYFAFFIRLGKWYREGLKAVAPENLLVFAQYFFMLYMTGDAWYSFKLWNVLHSSSNITFMMIAISGTHHHPEIYHDGDAVREDQDWGFQQLDAVANRLEIYGNFWLSAMSFGDHSLHHLFPTIDHSKLHYLYPDLFKTCEEFGYTFEYKTSKELLRGLYAQLLRIKPNPVSPDQRKKQLAQQSFPIHGMATN